MCTNKRWIYNKYSGNKILVGCGSCPACKMAYSNKVASRIRNHGHIGFKPLFVHLTYMDKYVPYIKRSELRGLEDISSEELSDCLFSVNVYRKTNRFPFRYYDRKLKHYTTDIIEFDNEIILSTESNKNHSDSRLYYKPLNKKHYAKVLKLRGQSDQERIGVIWYPDVQNFIKRLKKRVFESSLEEKHFDVFICSEYGETYQRPHFHLLIWIPETFINWYKCAITECWPFAVPYRTKNYIDWAKNAAKYVSTYLNKSVNHPAFFRNLYRRNRERFSHSKNFGFANQQFSFESLVKAISRNSVEYNTFVRKGIKSYAYDAVRIPSYVFGRYFPINFKGISRFNDYEVYNIIKQPMQIAWIVNNNYERFLFKDTKVICLQIDKKFQKYGLFSDDSDLYGKEFFKLQSYVEKSYYPIFNYNSDDYNSIAKFIERKFYNFKILFYPLLFNFLAPLNAYDLKISDSLLREYFAYFTVKLLKLLRRYRWMKHFEKNDSDKDNLERYDNLDICNIPEDLKCIMVHYDVKPIDLNPNRLACNISVTNQLCEDYFEYQKEHEINDFKTTIKDGKY